MKADVSCFYCWFSAEKRTRTRTKKSGAFTRFFAAVKHLWSASAFKVPAKQNCGDKNHDNNHVGTSFSRSKICDQGLHCQSYLLYPAYTLWKEELRGDWTFPVFLLPSVLFSPTEYLWGWESRTRHDMTRSSFKHSELAELRSGVWAGMSFFKAKEILNNTKLS